MITLEIANMEKEQLRLTGIVCKTSNNVIGFNGSIPWHISEDLKHFAKVTEGGVLVMGRKTYIDALTTYNVRYPGKADITEKDVFPGRHVIVISHTFPNQTQGTLTMVNSEEDLRAEINAWKAKGKEVFICGGREIFDMFIEDIYTLHITEIEGNWVPHKEYRAEGKEPVKFYSAEELMLKRLMMYSAEILGNCVDRYNPNWEMRVTTQVWKRVKSVTTGEIL